MKILLYSAHTYFALSVISVFFFLNNVVCFTRYIPNAEAHTSIEYQRQALQTMEKEQEM